MVGDFQYQNHDRNGVPVQLGRPLTRHYDDNDEAINDPAADMSPAETVQQRSEAIGELARQLSRHTTRGPENVFDYQEGSDLDPFSGNFDARKYTKALGQMSKGQGVERLSGVSYKDMSVHGFGSDAGKSRESHSCHADR
jgi:ATP-binding cassette subfamily G (WHITE) protein 2 (PDR)